MTRIWLRFLLLGVGVLAALGSGRSSVSPAARETTDQRIASIITQDREVPAPGEDAAPALAPGQWVTFKDLNSDGYPSVSTYVVSEQVDDAFWYEVHVDNYHGHFEMRLLVAVGDGRDPARFEVRALMTKDANGQIQSRSEPYIRGARPGLTGMLLPLVRPQPMSVQDDQVVPAGRFRGCFEAHGPAWFPGGQEQAQVWTHPAVPLGGTVKVRVAPREVHELVDFGFEDPPVKF